MTQKKIILSLLASQPDKKFFSYELMKASTPFGWLGSSGDRRARELAEEGLINRKQEKFYTTYWFKPIEKSEMYIKKPTTLKLI